MTNKVKFLHVRMIDTDENGDGWLMRELQLDFSTRHFLCGEGPVYWQGWQIGKAQQLDGGDWRVEIEGKTELTRQLMDRFTTAKTY